MTDLEYIQAEIRSVAHNLGFDDKIAWDDPTWPEAFSGYFNGWWLDPDRDLEAQNRAADVTAGKLLAIVKTGKQHGKFGSELIQTCADAILAMHTAVSRRHIEAEIEARAARLARDENARLVIARRDLIIELRAILKEIVETTRSDDVLLDGAKRLETAHKLAKAALNAEEKTE
jgi:hypothetical protein